MRKTVKYYEERYIRLHNIYMITLKKIKLLKEERERHNKLIEQQQIKIQMLEKRLKKYEDNSISK